MGRCYGHFSLEERCELSRLSHAGKTIRQIAAAMDRAPSTVARELKRNSGAKVGYQPAYAEQQAKSRRWRGCRLLRNTALQEQVLHGLRRGWSPAQVAGGLKTIAGDTTCLGAKAKEVGVDVKVADWLTASRNACLSSSVLLMFISADSLATGKGIWCCLRNMVKPC